ncbi:MAG: hypothetical protein HN509_16310 [Halobacteriovoraceae bacterium]|jgi:hypothetical protein|nr:hypothetical protein [Halobacteriovoraceae bacterium]MBT5095356.1 hypothetical protein [Halobacteriovoraceae bacterium]
MKGYNLILISLVSVLIMSCGGSDDTGSGGEQNPLRNVGNPYQVADCENLWQEQVFSRREGMVTKYSVVDRVDRFGQQRVTREGTVQIRVREAGPYQFRETVIKKQTFPGRYFDRRTRLVSRNQFVSTCQNNSQRGIPVSRDYMQAGQVTTQDNRMANTTAGDFESRYTASRSTAGSIPTTYQEWRATSFGIMVKGIELKETTGASRTYELIEFTVPNE